ncbi:MAG: neutral/alkaline non-lysosomal ceramidase N-terminal domain-containing protein [Opitutae bacterium]|nr:neutral/alkaline non-lysosomal ceramidase N-terminal domain-containing protein [Opitutae bacterium]
MKAMPSLALTAGAAQRDICPTRPMFLVGYPHVERTSRGIHDLIFASAFYLANGRSSILTVAVDVCYVMAETARTCRDAISRATGVPVENICISPTHTHSAPQTADILAWHGDPVVPLPAPVYLEQFMRAIIEAAVAAKETAVPATLAITRTEAHGVGRNRHDPAGVADHEVGLVYTRRRDNGAPIGLLLVYSMHPTVLHEDSKLVSSDFPHYTRAVIEEKFPGITVAYHNGTSGDQSPRHEVFGQTFAEAERLGRALGSAVVSELRALRAGDFLDRAVLAAGREFVRLPVRRLPPLSAAERALRRAQDRYDRLKAQGAGHGAIRTQECMLFGKQFVVRILRSGRLRQMLRRYQPAEVQVLQVADTFIAALPGELFVEFGLDIKKRAPGRAFVVSMANGELHGYIVTPQANAAGCYEAGFSTFTPAAGTRLADTAVRLMKKLRRRS